MRCCKKRMTLAMCRLCVEIEIFIRNAYGLEDTSRFVNYALLQETDDFRVRLCVKIEIFIRNVYSLEDTSSFVRYALF